jgi:peptide deformylase
MSHPRSILKFDSPSLRQPCTPVEYDDDIDFIEDMIELLKATRNGVGLAAPQIGVLKQVILIKPLGWKEPRVFINPVIISESKKQNTDIEGCLSYPDLFVDVSRPNTIKLTSLDRRWKRQTDRFETFAARIACHEMDHLRGVCLVGDVWRKQQLTGTTHEEQDQAQPNGARDSR